MNPSSPREELEIRLTALLLGELPPDEAATLRAAIARDAELSALHAKLARAVRLLREASALPERSPESVPAKLSDERRARLLAHFKTGAPTHSRVIALPRRDWKWAVPLGLAATLMALIGGAMFVEGFGLRRPSAVYEKMAAEDRSGRISAGPAVSKENKQAAYRDGSARHFSVTNSLDDLSYGKLTDASGRLITDRHRDGFPDVAEEPKAQVDTATIDKSRFFLTPHSNSPELNLFGRPREQTWPLTSASVQNPKPKSDDLKLAGNQRADGVVSKTQGAGTLALPATGGVSGASGSPALPVTVANAGAQSTVTFGNGVSLAVPAVPVSAGTALVGSTNGTSFVSSSGLSVQNASAASSIVDLNGRAATVNSLAFGGGLTASFAGLSQPASPVADASAIASDTGAATSPTFAITKAGSGTLTLSGANSYTGGTTVTAGVLSGTHSIAPRTQSDPAFVAGAFWDTPKVQTYFDRGINGNPSAFRGGLATSVPLRDEFQNYDGRPATTSLGIVGNHTASNATVSQDALWLPQLSLTPDLRVDYGMPIREKSAVRTDGGSDHRGVVEVTKSDAPVAGANTNDKDARADNPVVGRIAFWTDDDTAKVNINTAGGNIADAAANIATPRGSGRWQEQPSFFTELNAPAERPDGGSEPAASGGVIAGGETTPMSKSGAGTWQMNGANTHTGTTTANGGTTPSKTAGDWYDFDFQTGTSFNFSKLALNQPATAQHRQKVEEAEHLFIQAKGYSDLGRYDLAERKYQEVLANDPHNIAAQNGREEAAQLKDRGARAGYNASRAIAMWEGDKEWARPHRRFDRDGSSADSSPGATANAPASAGASGERGLDETTTRQLPTITGNTRTKDKLIRRELDFAPGDLVNAARDIASGNAPARQQRDAAHFDTGIGEFPDGGFAGKPDEGNHAGSTPPPATNGPAVGGRLEKQVAETTRVEVEKEGAKKNDEKRREAGMPAAMPAPNPLVPQPEVRTAENAFSTFSLNVSDVAFKLAAASLERGAMPDVSTLRSEEFINAFDYRDPEAAPGAPLAFASERARYPFAQNRDLLRLSVKTAAAGRQAGKPLNVVLLIDNSGSMERADRVRILREGLRTLAAQLQPQDKLSLVTFARTPHLWADGVAGDKAAEATARVSQITPEGGTDLSAALDLGYRTALKHYQVGSINHVVLLTDGAANLGDVDPAALKQKVEAHRKQGIALDCFGIGWEGLNDDMLEQLSRNGDGRYGFINTPEEAATNFAGQLAGALRVAASDVKVQVEWNPKRVTLYRQVGYAKHQLTKEQFRDNTVDAAELAAAESGNALYVVEVNPRGEGDLATVRVRFKVPGTSDYREHEWTVPFTCAAAPLEESSSTLRLAATAAAFSEMLAGSPFATEVTSDRLLQLVNGLPAIYGADPRPQKLEWMIRQAKSISGR